MILRPVTPSTGPVQASIIFQKEQPIKNPLRFIINLSYEECESAKRFSAS